MNPGVIVSQISILEVINDIVLNALPLPHYSVELLKNLSDSPDYVILILQIFIFAVV